MYGDDCLRQVMAISGRTVELDPPTPHADVADRRTSLRKMWSPDDARTAPIRPTSLLPRRVPRPGVPPAATEHSPDCSDHELVRIHDALRRLR